MQCKNGAVRGEKQALSGARVPSSKMRESYCHACCSLFMVTSANYKELGINFHMGLHRGRVCVPKSSSETFCVSGKCGKHLNKISVKERPYSKSRSGWCLNMKSVFEPKINYLKMN